MKEANTLEKGHKAKLNVLLKPVYELGNKIVCEYASYGDLKELSFHSDDLMRVPGEAGKMVLVKDLIVEEVLEDLVICKIEGSRQHLPLPKGDLKIKENGWESDKSSGFRHTAFKGVW